MQTVSCLFLPQIEEKKLSLKFSVDKDVPGVLFGDPLRITQILMNFVSNAIKFTSKGFIKIHVAVNKSSSPSEMQQQYVMIVFLSVAILVTCFCYCSVKKRDYSYLSGMNKDNSIPISIFVEDTGIGILELGLTAISITKY